jgi:type I restriction enzyme, S subunit
VGVFAELQNWQPIGDVCKVQSGYAFKSETFRRSGLRLLRNANIVPGRVYWDDTVYISAEEAEKFPSYRLSAGDVLISLDRPVISSGIKVARVCESDLPALLLQRVGRFLMDRHRIDPSYLYAFLQTEFFISEVSGHEQSLGVPHISPAQVEAVRIPLPDLETQRLLAAKLTAIADAWTSATESLHSQAEDLCVLPQRLLAQAFAY